MVSEAVFGRETPPLYDLALLPSSTRLGDGVRIYAHRVTLEANVTLDDDVILVADEITLGRGVTLGRDVDLRASGITIGAGSEVHSGVRILVAEQFEVGVAARIASSVSILCRSFVAGRLLYLGDFVTVGYGGTTTSTAVVRIGNCVTIGQHTILNANYPIEVGDNVGTGSYLAIWTHGYHFGHGPLDGIKPSYAPVRIGRNVWLGFHVTLLPGVSVGDNSIIAAGSVVTRDIPNDVLAAGVPACVRKELERKLVDGGEALQAVTSVLRVWHQELEWKGCCVTILNPGDNASESVVSLGDGSHRTRIVLLAEGAPIPAEEADESLILITVDERPKLSEANKPSVCLFTLRTGRVQGPRSPIVEDLRDQLRRHALPCGDDSCFSSIPPASFARLQTVAPHKPGR